MGGSVGGSATAIYIGKWGIEIAGCNRLGTAYYGTRTIINYQETLDPILIFNTFTPGNGISMNCARVRADDGDSPYLMGGG